MKAADSSAWESPACLFVQPPFIIAIVKALLLPVLLLATMVCCWAKPIPPEEAKNHIGENASVRGLVEQVSFSKKGHAFLNFGGKYPQHVFTGFVPAQNVEMVGGEKFLQSLAGNPITVTGKIELYKGRPEIVISSPTQIRQGLEKCNSNEKESVAGPAIRRNS